MPTKVWKTLEIKKRDEDVKLRFQQLPNERREEVIEFNIKNALQNDAFIKATGIKNNEEALKEYKTFMKSTFSYEIPHTTICCEDDGSESGGTLVGITYLYLVKKTEKVADFIREYPAQTKEMKRWYDMWIYMEKSLKIQTKFDKYYSGTTLIDPEYSGLGIANEFLKIRTLISKEDNVPMTGDWLCTEEEQTAAEKNNWETEVVLDLEDMGKSCSVTFEDNSTIKFMYTVIT